MARPGTITEKVKEKSDIVRIVGEYISLRKAGVSWVGLCPFHNEKTPSFSVHPIRQIFHCFGCGEGGDVFKFVMLIENFSFPEALRLLAEKSGMRLQVKDRIHGANDPQTKEREALFHLHEVVAQFYSEQMNATAEGRAARAYLSDRGLTGPVISRFGLGYAPTSGRVLSPFLVKKGFEARVIELSGLVVAETGLRGKKNYLDRFRRRVIFPLTDERGKIIGFAARVLSAADSSSPKYLNSPETPIYRKSRVLYNLSGAGKVIRKLEFAILVEGYMDCIALSSAGIKNGVASCGTSLTNAQVRLLSRYTRHVVVSFDPDTAGIRATERSLDLLLEEGFKVRVLELPEGLDPDGFLRKRGSEAYRRLLDQAPSYMDYLTDRTAKQFDLGSGEGKVAAVNSLLPRLARIPGRILRAETARRVAELLKVDERLLLEEITRAAVERRSEVVELKRESGPAVTEAEKQMLQILFDDAKLRSDFLLRFEQMPLHQGLASEEIFNLMLTKSAEGSMEGVSNFWNQLDPEKQKLLYHILSLPLGRLGRREAEACWSALRRRQMEVKREKLQREIERAEKNRDQKLLYQLVRDKSHLNKELAEIKKM